MAVEGLDELFCGLGVGCVGGDRYCVEDGAAALFLGYFLAVGVGVVEVDAGGFVDCGQGGVAEVDFFGEAEEF